MQGPHVIKNQEAKIEGNVMGGDQIPEECQHRLFREVRKEDLSMLCGIVVKLQPILITLHAGYMVNTHKVLYDQHNRIYGIIGYMFNCLWTKPLIISTVRSA